jgi:hypothetical protein
MICSAPGQRSEGKEGARLGNLTLDFVPFTQAVPLRIATTLYSAAEVVLSRDDAKIENLKTVLKI